MAKNLMTAKEFLLDQMKDYDQAEYNSKTLGAVAELMDLYHKYRIKYSKKDFYCEDAHVEKFGIPMECTEQCEVCEVTQGKENVKPNVKRWK